MNALIKTTKFIRHMNIRQRVLGSTQVTLFECSVIFFSQKDTRIPKIVAIIKGDIRIR